MAKAKVEWVIATIVGWLFVLLGILIGVVGSKTGEFAVLICGVIMANGSVLLTFYAMIRLTGGNDGKP